MRRRRPRSDPERGHPNRQGKRTSSKPKSGYRSYWQESQNREHNGACWAPCAVGEQMFKPLRLLLDRVQAHGADSDSAMFQELLLAGEFITKATTCAMVALIQDDRESHRYRLLHTLVRADGVGEWAAALDQALTGPASQHLVPSARDIRRVFTERSDPGSWQDRSVKELYSVLAGLNSEAPRPADRPQLRSWFQMFSEIRNKTRGHGATTPATAARLVAALHISVNLMAENSPVLGLPYAYLHRNLSGKYRVVSLGGDQGSFDVLKGSKGMELKNLSQGIYVNIDGFRQIDLLQTDLDASDFFVANGAFKNGVYELHSLITDNRLRGDASLYMAPATERPASETEGRGTLEPLENIFTNLPAQAPGYVRRPALEDEISRAFLNDRHPIVTLVGRGGIGKTSAALTVLHEIAAKDRFDVVVWFSARDIDLTVSGAKPVKPHVLTEGEISSEYVRLIGDDAQTTKGATATLASHLTNSPLGATLFVFDNFETVRSPLDLFHWIDTNIRLPNKAVITSRFRDFKADYPIEVQGMEDDEAEQLVHSTLAAIGFSNLLSKQQIAEVIEEADGHPYVIKILLGEMANDGAYSKPARLIARKDDILEALFERTYASLTPLAARAFLVLSSWRSLVPQLALEATLLRQGEDVADPEAAIDQLVRTSLVERLTAPDESDFLEVPLTAATFGKRKLAVSPGRATVENDVRFLQDVGATATTGLKEGIAPKIDTLFRRAARRALAEPSTLKDIRPVLEFLANHHKRAWLLLADIESEAGEREKAAEALRRFLATQPTGQIAQEAWRRLRDLYRESGDVVAACDAFLRAATITEPPMSELSMVANWLNNSAEAWTHLHTSERATIFSPLARMMEDGITEATATDLSRLAWLYLHVGNDGRALQVAEEGLYRDPSNIHCTRLRAKILNL